MAVPVPEVMEAGITRVKCRGAALSKHHGQPANWIPPQRLNFAGEAFQTIFAYGTHRVLVVALNRSGPLSIASARDTNLGTKRNPTIVLLPDMRFSLHP
jgi:hypothetical protein